MFYINKKDEKNILSEINNFGFKGWVVGEIIKNTNKKNVDFIGLND